MDHSGFMRSICSWVRGRGSKIWVQHRSLSVPCWKVDSRHARDGRLLPSALPACYATDNNIVCKDSWFWFDHCNVMRSICSWVRGRVSKIWVLKLNWVAFSALLDDWSLLWTCWLGCPGKLGKATPLFIGTVFTVRGQCGRYMSTTQVPICPMLEGRHTLLNALPDCYVTDDNIVCEDPCVSCTKMDVL